MPENPAVSIVVPVYKVEAYLKNCVRSILAQTYADFECILVDDGSPDSCGDICDALAREDGRVRVIHRQNGGLSAARNTGIEAARGRYIAFVDSDDTVLPGMYENLVKQVENTGVQMAVCGLFDCVDGKHIPQDIPQKQGVLSRPEAVEYLFAGKGPGLYAWNKLYDRALFDRVRFPEGKLYEDAFVMLPLLMQCEKISVDTTPQYCYLHRGDSIMLGRFHPGVFDVLDAHKANLECIQRELPDLVPVGEFRVWWAYKHILERILLSDFESRERYMPQARETAGFIRRNMGKIWRNPYNSRNQKIAFLAAGTSLWLFEQMLRGSRRR